MFSKKPLRLFSSPRYVADLGNHVMPIHKFDLVRQEAEKSGLWLDILEPTPASDEELLRVHTAEYVSAIETGEPLVLAQSQKFPWSARLAEAVRYTNGGCIAALFAALEDGLAANLASGFHHAHADHGEGFCTFNGLIVALEKALAEKKISRGLVLDFDLHYGNGTASLLATRPQFYGLSVYGSWYKNNVAYREVDQEYPADISNTRSVAVPNGSGRDVYLDIVRQEVPRAIEAARPDVILYQAGADPYREDPYSPLDLGIEDLHERDRLVFSYAKEEKIPIVWVLAGGYTKDTSKIVSVHHGTLLAAAEVYELPMRT